MYTSKNIRKSNPEIHPGTGKSSIIFSLAGEIGYDICFLSLSSPHLNDDALATAMSKVFVKTIVLIEDIDSAFDHKDSTDAPNKMADSCKVTFKGILNALDGVSSQEGRIVFITTNHIKKLDPALIRPGRVDVKICIDYATEDQIRKMFARFYPHVEPQVVKEMCLKIQKGLKKSRKKASMACLQSLFILHKDNPNDAVDHAEKHFEEYADSANTGYLDFYM
ncbi:probable mitochondrial chaperone bcs1 [Folsomia candida]|uniref:probable mitochondrial chaperone bcs1 n=1 Tax=Folsomia candida TaxID=158441 RepID=UPI000B8FE8B1|nr:probable mitochondrial chaperone bcs1 [Folsomia candida]